jgi:hypothetical protein
MMMKKLIMLLMMALVTPVSALALEAPVEEEEACPFVEFFTADVPFFFTQSVPAGATAVWSEVKYRSVVTAVAVSVFVKSAVVGTKNVTVDTAVAIRDTTVEVTKPLFW